MPKKLQTNQKAADARARKDAIKQAEKERVQKAKDDEFWRDDDKQLAKKQARKEERERKEAEERERKKEREKLLQEEMAQIKGKESTDRKPTKVTRSQIDKTLSTMAATTNTPKETRIVQQDLALVVNVNKVPEKTEEARTVDEAITLMSKLGCGGEPEVDRHPEKRLKAAWEAFESARLPILKSENPNLRLSQLRQMIRKEWQKSPENPLNQRILAYNMKREQKVEEDE